MGDGEDSKEGDEPKIFACVLKGGSLPLLVGLMRRAKTEHDDRRIFDRDRRPLRAIWLNGFRAYSNSTGSH